MQCPRCLAQNREGRRFCAECGASLALSCPSCGFSNEPGEKFCGGCGVALTPAAQPPKSASRAPHAYTPGYLADKILTLKSAEVRRAHGLEMRRRVGLNAGEAVVRAIDNGLHMDYSAVGETMHLAAPMGQLATPGGIRLTAVALRLVKGLVQVNALGLVPVKGLAEPIEIFELLGASGTQRRIQAAAARGLTQFVGRQTEMVTFTDVLALACPSSD